MIVAIFIYGTIATIFIGALTILTRFLKWRNSPLNRIPGPIKVLNFKSWLKGTFNMLESEEFMKPYQRWWAEAGPDTPLLHFSGVLGKQFVVVLDADGIKQILTAPAGVERPRFEKKLALVQIVLGNGLVALDGTDWHRHRRIIQPSFNNNFLKDALSSCVPGLMDRLFASWKKKSGCDIDICSHFSAVTVDIIGKVAFSHEFNATESIEEWAEGETNDVDLKDPLLKALYVSLMPSKFRMLLVTLGLARLVKYLIRSSYETQLLLNKAVDSVVEKAYDRYKLENENGSNKAKCLLDLLFDAKDTEPGSRQRKLTSQELRDETKTFLVAGHETTATLCVWAVYCLIQNPRVESRLLEEINECCGGGHVTIEAVEKMEYLDAFVNEVLRMYPPVGMIVRNVSESFNLLGEFIPEKTRLILPIYLLQRHHKYWNDPLEFKPERWLKGNENDRKLFHHFAFLPFSAGGRNCIGQRFAMYEAKLILAPLIRDFKMSLSPSLEGVKLKLTSFVTIKSKPPILIHAKPRS